MKLKRIPILVSIILAASIYLVAEPYVIQSGRLTVTTEEATQGDAPAYRAYTYGSHDYEDYTFVAYWPSGQKRTIPFDPSMISDSDMEKFDTLGKHEIEVTYQKGKTVIKIEVILPDDPLVHILIFDSNGGSDVDPILDISNGTIVTLPVPEKAGYVFLGWYTALDDSGQLIDNQTPITESMLLYAKWEVLLT